MALNFENYRGRKFLA